MYLRPSELCDSDHLFVKENALKITMRAETPTEAAIKIFYFVRDMIKLVMVHPWKTASEVTMSQE